MTSSNFAKWIVCPASEVDRARSIASQLGWAGEFRVPLSFNGSEPPTHYAGHGHLVNTPEEKELIPWATTSVQELSVILSQLALTVIFVPSDQRDPWTPLKTVLGLQKVGAPDVPEEER